MDKVFKALADDTRRRLLDRLHENNGQTLGELCEHFAMSRQSVTQHLALLEAANLIGTVRRGREKLHYLNPVPLHEIQERWIDKFERPRLQALGALKRRAEEAMTDKPSFVYVTYIASTPEKVWEALTDADLTAAYWGHRNVSDWRPGSRWEHVRTDGSGIADVVGRVVESEPPTRLVTTWAAPDQEEREDRHSRVTFEIRPHEDIVRLTVVHEDLNDEGERSDVASGWPAVLSNLKSLLETGRTLPQEPWLVPGH
ncbi:ArsR/SmtB family transcription factor [Streptomyces sp. NPDC059688]|uniref:Metalloregulator ArsR/SmtB family transcription factor n=2 Tax=Streptomyces TaxID=1883 RepID=A0ABV1UHC3_9ACTN|nr:MULTISPECIES: metalloregulator ArsR/SmtB family transcription factor [unclassified Streptomyces]OKJ81632.1 ArsR family transcriptional regulator [Streptomyces sp. CB01883]ROP55103.1 ArsR family transcriptional regulator [Streptomyces sp. PanSC9]UXY40040.1 metalloregulator ArsR/SmtB family transcription factor [Streptomyces sp. HUAS 14-6]